MNKEESGKTHRFYKKIKGVTGVLGWILFATLIMMALFLLLVLISNKVAEKKNQKPIMGLYTIVSPSMTGSIEVYDVVFVLRVPTKMIHRGDVITFRAENTIFGDTPVTHRVIEKYTDNDGQTVYVTKGDYNQFKDDFYAYERNVVGKVLFKIPQLGRIQFFLVGKKGWFVVVLLPALAIIATDIFKILKVVVIGNDKTKTYEEKEGEANEEIITKRRTSVRQEIKIVKEQKPSRTRTGTRTRRTTTTTTRKKRNSK